MLTLLLISLAVLIGASLALLLVLNGMVYAYENEKLEALTNQIKQKNGLNILNKGAAKRSFSTFDLNKSIKKSKQLVSSILKDAGEQFQKIKTSDKLKKENIVGGVKSLGGSTKTAVSSLSSLIKPIKPEEKQEILKEETYKEDVENLVQKVEGNREEDIHSQATINMASDTGRENVNKGVEKTHSDYKTFSRLEQKILKRLQDDGMQHYDIWLELGQLYLKYDQTEKAKEVFALVLKHAPQDSKIKEIARNELIGLG